MPETCSVCTKTVTSSRFPGVKCSKCKKAYHNSCANITEVLYKSLSNGSASWFCNTCHVSTRTSIVVSDDIETPNIPANPCLNDVIVILESMQQKLDALEASQKFVCSSLDDINSTIKLLTKENKQLKEQVSQLEDKYLQQEFRLNLLEAQADVQNQLENKNSVVIYGLHMPQNDDETIADEILNILTKVDMNISSNNIDTITKMYHNKNSKSRLRNSFIVNFKSLQLKNDLLSAFRKHKLSNATPNVFKNINIIHYFTKYQSRLYKEAKRIQSDFGYTFMWCKDGKIFLRKTQNSEIHHIHSFNDTSRLQNTFRTLEVQGKSSDIV